MNKKSKVTDANYVPIHAIGGYLSQLKIKAKKEQEMHNNDED